MNNASSDITAPPQVHERGKVRRPTMALPFASSSNSSGSSLDEKKALAMTQNDQRHLRSYGRTDIIRQKPGFLGWTFSRWLLLLANTVLLIYGGVFLVATTATYANRFEHAIVIVVANKEILAVGFIGSLCCLLTSIVGYIGIVHKNRLYLGYYSLMLWGCFALITTVGYLGFKQRTWNLKAQLGVRWRHDYDAKQRELLQANLHCCGFENPSDHATYFSRCWAESLLPGCQHKFYLFENTFLLNTYTMAFSILPLHMVVMVVALLCANHVDVVFGTRKRPPIAYLGKFNDWREWEMAQKQQ